MALLLWWTPRALADAQDAAASAQENATARALFEEGLKFVGAAKWSDAEDRFRRVLAIRSSQVAAYNLASALVHLDRVVESAELLRAILRDPAAPEDTRAAAKQLLGEIEPKIGTLTVRLVGDAADCKVSLDDAPVETSALGRPISVDPGAHAIVVRRDDEVVAQRDVRVGGRAPLRVETSLEIAARPRLVKVAPVVTPVASSAPASAAPSAGERVELSVANASAPAPSDDEGGSGAPWWLWAGAGAAVVAAVVIVAVVSAPSDPRPVAGDTQPATVRGVVRGAMP